MKTAFPFFQAAQILITNWQVKSLKKQSMSRKRDMHPRHRTTPKLRYAKMNDSTDQTQPLVEHLIGICAAVWCMPRWVWRCVFIAIVPFAQQLYAFVAQPLMSVLPENTSMIATDVVAPIFCTH